MEARSQLRHRPIRREYNNLIFAYVRGIVKPGRQILCIRWKISILIGELAQGCISLRK